MLVADALRSAATDAPAAVPRLLAVVTPCACPAAVRLSSSSPPPRRRLVYQVCTTAPRAPFLASSALTALLTSRAACPSDVQVTNHEVMAAMLSPGWPVVSAAH